VDRDALAEVYAFADALRAHAQSDDERQTFERDRVFMVQIQMEWMNMGTPRNGECTSVVVRRPSGAVAHFRNWDFGPLPDVLGMLSTEVDFFFGHSKRHGFRCLLALTHPNKWTTCMKEGAFSMSLNAREYGSGHEHGRTAAAELARLQAGALTRVALLRKVMLADSFDAALTVAATSHMLTSMYIILAGPPEAPSKLGGTHAASTEHGRGAVITLSGNGSSADVLPLPEPGVGWFLVQTNVDHWLPMSQAAASSHRREHVRTILTTLGQEASMMNLYSVLQDQHVFPPGNAGPDDGRIFRPSTIASIMMLPQGAAVSGRSWNVSLWRPASSTRLGHMPTLIVS